MSDIFKRLANFPNVNTLYDDKKKEIVKAIKNSKKKHVK